MTKTNNYNLTYTQLKNRLKKLEHSYYEDKNIFMTEAQFINEKWNLKHNTETCPKIWYRVIKSLNIEDVG